MTDEKTERTFKSKTISSIVNRVYVQVTWWKH